MRCMCRNERTVYYRKYAGLTDVVNEDGYYTGEQEAKYEDAEEIRGVVSPPTGEAYRDIFGMLDDYDCVLTVSDPECPIREEDIVLFARRKSDDTQDEYIVKRCAPSLNTCAFALTKVNRT